MTTVAQTSLVGVKAQSGAKQSALVKYVSKSDATRVKKILKGDVAVDDLAAAIRASNKIVAQAVKGAKTGFLPREVDKALREKMAKLDAGHAVLREEIAEGKTSAADLHEFHNQRLTAEKEAAAARQPAVDRQIRELAAQGEEMRRLRGQAAAAPVESQSQGLTGKVIFDFAQSPGRGPSEDAITRYNAALDQAETVKVSINGRESEVAADRATATYSGGNYSMVAGAYTDEASIKVTVLK